MADLTISNTHIAERLREIAARENRSIEDVLETLIEAYSPPSMITMPTENDQAIAIQKMRRRIYSDARDYWREHGNTDRLNLTDDELDEQFWCIDPDGIPRLNSDQSHITLPPSPFVEMAHAARATLTENDPPIDVSSRVNEIMRRHE